MWRNINSKIFYKALFQYNKEFVKFLLSHRKMVW